MQSIAQIATVVATQDNYCSEHPLFLVQETHRIYGLEEGYANNYVWISQDDKPIEADAETVARIEAAWAGHCGDDQIDLSDADDPEHIVTWKRVWYRDDWRYVTTCFTRTAAEEFIATKAHRYSGKLRVWVKSAHDNPEMIAVRKYLLEMAKGSAK